ncbi:MAG TPA: DUF2934 domain-containing protein [Vicinamibacterales bacterium]|jgi:hypothetical protein|nr:DUF2934 domain-containing protein [Vicinamibacterales bacterium]
MPLKASRTSKPDVSDHKEFTAPTHDDIAQRAYDHYLERGASDGADVEDWLEAERELLEQRTSELDRADWDEDPSTAPKK